jgi:hypothetical protein
VRLPSASLLLSHLSEFLVIREIYSAPCPLQVPGKRANRTSGFRETCKSNSVEIGMG